MTALAKRLVQRILYKDDFLLAFDKWAGLTIQGDPKGESLAGAFKQLKLRQADQLSLVHRLDKATSGVCLVARNQGVQQRLHRLFHDGKVKKQYHAITIGVPYPPKGTITGFIGAAAANPQALVYSPTGADLGTSKVEATTKYRVIKHLDTTTALVELTPITGRKHQLRVHCAQALLCPIVGDSLYGPCYSNAIRARLSTKRGLLGASNVDILPLMLHASKLELSDYAKAMEGLETIVAPTPTQPNYSELAKLEQLLTPAELDELAERNPTIRSELERRDQPAVVVKTRAPPTRLTVTAAVPSEMREVLHQLGLQDDGIQRQAQRKRSQQRYTPRRQLKGSTR